MAIVSAPAMGKAKGSVGNVTFRTLGDTVVASQKVLPSTKPRTYAQVSRNVHFSNIVNAYTGLVSANLPVKKFFPRVGCSSGYSHFMKANIAKDSVFAVALSKSDSLQKIICPAPFIVSSGALPIPEVLLNNFSNGVVTLDIGSSPLSSYSDLSIFLINNCGVIDGDELYFVSMRITDVMPIFVSQKFVVDRDSSEDLPAWIKSNGKMTIDPYPAELNDGIVIRLSGDVVSPSSFSNDVLSSSVYQHFTSQSYIESSIESYGYRK